MHSWGLRKGLGKGQIPGRFRAAHEAAPAACTRLSTRPQRVDGGVAPGPTYFLPTPPAYSVAGAPSSGGGGSRGRGGGDDGGDWVESTQGACSGAASLMLLALAAPQLLTPGAREAGEGLVAAAAAAPPPLGTRAPLPARAGLLGGL